MTTDLTPHQDHERAQRKHAIWRDEILAWKSDHRRALETLQQATLFVQEHDALLDHHATLIDEHEQMLERHEEALDAGEVSEGQALSEHDRLEQVHQQVLEQHNRFRGRHPALMQEIARLAVELHKVSHQPG